MRARAFLACMLAAGTAFAQLTDLDPDWKELEIAPPAQFSTQRLVPIEMPRYMSVRLGVVPESLTVSGDGIVRYVMVATSPSGSVNATFEGIRCRTGEVKVYARHGSDGQWNRIDNAPWKSLSGNQPSMHALALARQGACDGRAATGASPEEIIRKLKSSASSGPQQ